MKTGRRHTVLHKMCARRSVTRSSVTADAMIGNWIMNVVRVNNILQDMRELSRNKD
jgi:hypothetical protein